MSSTSSKGGALNQSTAVTEIKPIISGGSVNGSNGPGIALTPRFTNEEKEILYSFFHQHEEVIDIKNRKKQKGKFSVRESWQQIVDGFNRHPSVSTQRNLKQIQKFWLNARLRKQYPFQPSRNIKSIKTSPSHHTSDSKSDITVPPPIKCEPDYALAGSETPDTTHHAEEYEEIELHASSVNDPLTVDSMDEPTETQQIHQENHQQIQQQITQQQSQHQQQHQQHQQQQQQQQATIQTQQISVDQISADKLTLNDLLHFKNARPREEIILQIKHPDGGSITLPSPSPTRITIPHQQTNTYNQIIGEIKSQPQQHIQVQHYQTQQLQPQQAPQQVTQQHQIQQQYNAGNSTYCTYTTQHLPQVTTQSNIAQANTSGNSTTSYMVTESLDEKINFFKLKEAELRYKEVQLQLEQKRLDLSRMQEELKHQKEMHRLMVEEMRIKIRILSEEEKRLRNKES